MEEGVTATEEEEEGKEEERGELGGFDCIGFSIFWSSAREVTLRSSIEGVGTVGEEKLVEEGEKVVEEEEGKLAVAAER